MGLYFGGLAERLLSTLPMMKAYSVQGRGMGYDKPSLFRVFLAIRAIMQSSTIKGIPSFEDVEHPLSETVPDNVGIPLSSSTVPNS